MAIVDGASIRNQLISYEIRLVLRPKIMRVDCYRSQEFMKLDCFGRQTSTKQYSACDYDWVQEKIWSSRWHVGHGSTWRHLILENDINLADLVDAPDAVLNVENYFLHYLFGVAETQKQGERQSGIK